MSQVELFLNSVPILANLSREERIRLVDAFEEVTYQAGQKVIVEGDKGDLFYIIKEGESIVYQSTAQGARKVNHLFKADFFGERALLKDEPRYGWRGGCGEVAGPTHDNKAGSGGLAAGRRRSEPGHGTTCIGATLAACQSRIGRPSGAP